MKTIREITQKLDVTSLQISVMQLAREAGLEPPISIRTVAEIADCIDSRVLRNNIISVTGIFRGRFPAVGEHFTTGVGLTESGINSFFDAGIEPQCVDCLGAARIIMAKGLINTLKNEEFNKLGYTASGMNIRYRPAATTNEIMPGDWCYFYNDYTYKYKHPAGPFQGENAIKVAATDYYGFGAGKYDQWEKEMIEAYNDPPTKEDESRKEYDPQYKEKQIDKVPGYTGDNQFFNVPIISMEVWKLRKSRYRLQERVSKTDSSKEEIRDSLIRKIRGTDNFGERIRIYRELVKIGDKVSLESLAASLLEDPITESREAIIDYALEGNVCSNELMYSIVRLAHGFGQEHKPVTPSRASDQWRHTLRRYLIWVINNDQCDLETRADAKDSLILLEKTNIEPEWCL